ncbi:MAG: ricin-type beta-trefoil lectin domain protein [Polyangiaceae bacterium]|nr:ricin-type beta-trefoil lectin domain protein [Polyangiaceae bacterium]
MKLSRVIFASVGLTVASVTGTAFADNQTFYIENKCLDVPASNTSNGTRVQIYDCNGGTNQQWQFWTDGSIRSALNTNKCLDLRNSDTTNGTPIQIWDCAGTTNQKWAFESDGTIRGFGGKCVDDPGGSSTNGTLLQYWDCIGGDGNQVFTDEPAISGDILARWLALGGATGVLGVPTSEDMAGPNGGRIRFFANGSIWLNGDGSRDTVVKLGDDEIILDLRKFPISLSIFSNGDYVFSGYFDRELATPFDRFALVWAADDGTQFAWGHEGEAFVSARDSWNLEGNYPALQDDWQNFSNSYTYLWHQERTTIPNDLGSLLTTVEGLLGAGANATKIVSALTDQGS